MDQRRKSPSTFRHKGTSIAFFVIALAILIAGVYFGIGMLTRFDYADVLPEDASLRAKFAKNGYIVDESELTETETAVSEENVADENHQAFTLPTPMPTPEATPLPLQVYSLQETRMVMPQSAVSSGEAALSDVHVSSADNNRSVIVSGWAFLDGYDAQNSTVYLVVSTKAGTVRRFYMTTPKPGSSGVVHDAAKGANLERADFQAAFKVGTYEDGSYYLGALVVHQGSDGQAEGYFEFQEESSQFTVKDNAVVSVG